MTRWRWASVAVALTIVAGLGFGALPKGHACAAIDPQPWIALQEATTAARAAQLVSACEGHLRGVMRYDALAFIPAFTAFLLASLWAARPRRSIALITLVMLAAGVAADQVEGIRLLGVIDAGGGTPAMIATANQASFAKVLFLALASAGLGAALAAASGWRRAGGSVIAVAALASASMTLASLNGAAALAVAWLTIALIVIIQSFRGTENA